MDFSSTFMYYALHTEFALVLLVSFETYLYDFNNISLHDSMLSNRIGQYDIPSYMKSSPYKICA